VTEWRLETETVEAWKKYSAPRRRFLRVQSSLRRKNDESC